MQRVHIICTINHQRLPMQRVHIICTINHQRLPMQRVHIICTINHQRLPMQRVHIICTINHQRLPMQRVKRHIVLYLPPGIFFFCLRLFVHLSVSLSVTKLCPLYNLKTVRDSSTKLHTFVKHIQTTCHAQEP